MDIPILAQDITTFLAPFLPYLVLAGEKAVEEAGKKFGAAAWEKAQALWGKLKPKVEAKPAAQEASQDVAKTPNDADAQAALRLQVKKLLTEDAELAKTLADLWESGPQTVSTVHIEQKAGDNAIQIGQARDVEIKR